MKKNDLIKMLLGIEGNPDVLMYNGSVCDWQHVALKLVVLKRIKKSVHGEIIKKERPYLTNDQVSSKLKKRKENWSLNEIGLMEDARVYESKKAILLSGKRRGIKVFDRAGTIEY